MQYIPGGQFLRRNEGKNVMKIGLASGIAGQPHVVELGLKDADNN